MERSAEGEIEQRVVNEAKEEQGEDHIHTLLYYCLVQHVDVRSLDIFASILLESSQSVPDAARSDVSG